MSLTDPPEHDPRETALTAILVAVLLFGGVCLLGLIVGR